MRRPVLIGIPTLAMLLGMLAAPYTGMAAPAPARCSAHAATVPVAVFSPEAARCHELISGLSGGAHQTRSSCWASRSRSLSSNRALPILASSTGCSTSSERSPRSTLRTPGHRITFSAGCSAASSPAPFRSFWLRNGGLQVFGHPLSEQFQEINRADGQTYWVQYFERQRMEWHPNEPTPRYPVQLGLLGDEYLDAFHAGETAFAPRTEAAIRDTQAFVYGFNASLFGQGSPWQNRPRVLQLAKDAGIYWIRQQVRWADLQPAPGAINWGVKRHHFS